MHPHAVVHIGVRVVFLAGILNAHKNLLAILQLIDELLVEFRFIGVRRRIQRPLHDLAKRPTGHDIVLVNVGDQETVGR